MHTASYPAVIFFTGLSGAGKTTIAKALQQRLHEKGLLPVMLDGDDIRQAIQLSAFDEESRKKHNLATGRLAALFEQQGHTVIVSLIAPYDAVRNAIRQLCTRFIEIYVCTSLETCIRRDPKGLYAKAIAGEIKDFTGISAPYQAPLQPELSLDTTNLNADECADAVVNLLIIPNE